MGRGAVAACVLVAIACGGNSNRDATSDDDDTAGESGHATTGGVSGTSPTAGDTSGGATTGGVTGAGGSSTGGTPTSTGGVSTGGVSTGGSSTGGATAGGGQGGVGAMGPIGGFGGTAGRFNMWPPPDCPFGACPREGEVRNCNELLPLTGIQTIPTTRVCCAGQWAPSCAGGMGGMSGMGGSGTSGIGGSAGVAGRGGTAGSSGTSGGGAGGNDCPTGCEPQPSGFCGSEQVTWVCTSTFDAQVFRDAGCTDPGTQVPRYCCPPAFKPECQ